MNLFYTGTLDIFLWFLCNRLVNNENISQCHPNHSNDQLELIRLQYQSSESEAGPIQTSSSTDLRLRPPR